MSIVQAYSYSLKIIGKICENNAVSKVMGNTQKNNAQLY